MWPEEDRRRLFESRHDLGACAKPADLTTRPAMQAAVVASAEELRNSREALKTASAAATLEKGETDAERLKLQEALEAAVRRYGFIRNKVDDALLNVDPDAGISPKEIEKRQKLFDRVFGTPVSDFARVSQGSAIETIGAVAKSLADEPDLVGLGYGPGLAAAAQTAEDAASHVNREVDEDAAAIEKLRVARGNLDEAAKAHALLVESILVRERRTQDLGRFVLAKDAAYAARRAARAPLSEEPGVSDVDAETPAAPLPPTNADSPS